MIIIYSTRVYSCPFSNKYRLTIVSQIKYRHFVEYEVCPKWTNGYMNEVSAISTKGWGDRDIYICALKAIKS